MQQARVSFYRRLFGLALAAFLLLRAALPAQQLGNADEVESFVKHEFQFRSKVMAGQETAPAAQFEQAAKYYVWRVTHVKYADPKVMERVHRDFEELALIVASPNNFKANRDAVGKLAPLLIARFKEVFALDINEPQNRLPIINAAIMLPSLAKFRTDDVAEYLTGILGDAKVHDAVKVHAVKALRDFFPARLFTKTDLGQGPITKQLEVRRDRDVKRIDLLLKFIDRPMPKFFDPQEVDGFRYVRAEAVMTLAATGVPAVSTYDKKKADGPVAVGLLKVLAKKVQPEPTVQERWEAALGVCHFATKYAEEYDPKIGIYLAGECFGDLLGEYKKDFNNITNKAKSKMPTYMPWKYVVKRTEAALTDLVNNTKGSPNAAAVQKMDAALRPMLKSIYNSDNVDPQAFREFVQTLRPKSKVLFRVEKGGEFEWEAAQAEEKQ